MLISTVNTLALYCPFCGRLTKHDVSRFSLSGASEVKLTCDCGNVAAIVRTRRHQQYMLYMYCSVCETKHLLTYGKKEFFSPKVAKIYCPETNAELGFIGERSEIEKIFRECLHELETLMNEADFDDYFANPEIIYDILNRLHDLAERGDLYCSCGCENIDIEIFQEHIELNCSRCGSLLMFPAKGEDDVKALRRLDVIELACRRNPPRSTPKGGK